MKIRTIKTILNMSNEELKTLIKNSIDKIYPEISYDTISLTIREDITIIELWKEYKND